MFKYEGLNTIETTWEGERLTIVEPLFLLDISSIAACFERYGHSPLLYLLQRMNQRNVNPYTLLGNFAGTALDETIRGERREEREMMFFRGRYGGISARKRWTSCAVRTSTA